MAGPTKMIIITSDEDIIRQFSLNKTKNTHIIDFNNDKQLTSAQNDQDNGIINLNLLAELSQLNPNHDQVFKRALDSPGHNQSKPVKAPRKSIDTICTICGDKAIGFNYDALSCASCKAFFRRNAHHNLDKMRCLTAQGQCSVAHETRRKCPKCRLNRCFSVGMRKDFILSDEDKQRRKKRLEENRTMTSQRASISESTTSSSTSNHLSTVESLSPTLDEIDHLLMELDHVDDNNVLHDNTDLNQIDDSFLKTLSVEDWVIIQNVQSSFLSAFQSSAAHSTNSSDLSDRDSALIAWSEIVTQHALHHINFFRQIEEFEGLNSDDRFTLIKYNLLSVIPISKCLHYKQTNGSCSTDGTDDAAKHRPFSILFAERNNISDAFMKLVLSLVQTTERDPALLSLLLTILIFSPGLSMDENEPSLKDSLAVHRAQSHYIGVFWNYLVNKWGEVQACKQLTQLLTLIFRMQSATKNVREFFRDEYMASDTMDKIGPLMQSVLHIS